MTPGDRGTTTEPWDDERLAAAFVDHYDRPAPRDLTATTLERVTDTPRRPRWWPSLDRPSGSRLVAAVALVAVVSLVGVAVLPRAPALPSGNGATSTGPSSIPSPAQNTPYQSFPASPTVEGFAATVAGLTVRSVADATRLFGDPEVGDTEFAIAGWYSARYQNRFCPVMLPGDSPLIDKCGAFNAWLSGDPDPLLKSDGQLLGDKTHGPTIEPRFISMSDAPNHLGQSVDPWTTIEPQPLILIGHIHDDRSSRCRLADAGVCERTFVVDQYASAAGVLPTPPIVKYVVPPRLDGTEALRVARERIAGFGMALKVDLQFNADAPWFANSSSGCACPLTWFARGYRVLVDDGSSDPRAPGTPVAAWLTIDDATGAIGGPLTAGIPDPAPPFAFAPAPAGFPATVEGLPVRTVADVVDPDRPPGLETPIAVAGWFSQLPLRPCPSVAPNCNRETVVLAGTDKRLVTYRTNGPSTEVAPDGPILNPAILPGGASPPPIVGNGAPQPAVFIVHAGDPRAYQRGSAPVGVDTFVLDQVAWLNGAVQGPTVWIAPELKLVRSPEQVLGETSGGALVAPGTWPISISAVLGRDLGTLGVVTSQSPASNVVVWVVRLVGRQPGGGASDVAGYGYVLVVGDSVIESTWTSP